MNFCGALFRVMASSGGNQSFASVVTSDRGEVKMVLNARVVQVTREEVEKCGDLVEGKENGMSVALSCGELEDQWKRIVLFGCVNRGSSKSINPPLGEIRPTFRKWVGKVEFSSGGGAFGTLVCVFKSEEVTYA